MISHRKIYFIISGVLIVLSAASLLLWQLNLGIDFKGGSLLRVDFEKNVPSLDKVKNSLSDMQLPGLSVQPIGDNGYLLRMENISEKKHQEIVGKLQGLESGMVEKRFASIGPTIGQELRRKALWAIVLSLVAVVVYISWAFRKVSYPVSSWKYGLCAICALFHDVLITIGVFTVLGHFMGVEVGVPFVAALLTIVGYSVNDTIVIFDRVRENIIKAIKDSFEKTVSLSVSQSITRSINTSLTTLLVLLAILIWGGETITFFILALIIGVILGTYSSLFIASPLLVEWEKRG